MGFKKSSVFILLSLSLAGCLSPEVLEPTVTSTSTPTPSPSGTNFSPTTVSFFSGSMRSFGFNDGDALTTARLASPRNIVEIGTDIYVADYGNRLIRKINSSGAVSTFAGTFQSNTIADGTGTAAKFMGPSGITAIGTDLYVAEGSISPAQKYNVIRKITSAGVVTTIAGTYNTFGTTDNTGALARFRGPLSITTDGTDLYVAELQNCIRKVTTAGVVTTFAGTCGSAGNVDTAGGSPLFGALRNITYDTVGHNFYVTDFTNASVRKITPAGVVTTVATGITSPQGITNNGTALFVSTAASEILRVDFNGTVTSVAGVNGTQGSSDGTGASALFLSPFALYYASPNFYVADSGNNMIRSMTGTYAVTRFAGTPGGKSGTTDGVASAARFSAANSSPNKIITNGTDLFFLDSDNSTIRKVLGTDGSVSTLAGNPGVSGYSDGTGAAATFGKILGAVFVGVDLVVTDQDIGDDICSLRKITPAGVVTTVLTGSCTAAGPIPQPFALAVVGSDFYVSNASNCLIYKVDHTLAVTTFAGIGGTCSSIDGPLGTNTMNRPVSLIAVGSDIYFPEGSRIRKLSTLTGIMTTVAGSASTGSADGVGTAASLNGAAGITTDGNGYLYISETTNGLIRKFEIATATLTTIAGNVAYDATSTASTSAQQDVDGSVANAWLFNPMGLTYNSSGLFVAQPGAIRWIH